MSTTKVHAIQTGSVRVKTAQVAGRGRGLARQFAIFADRAWTDWLPTYAWAIEHDEGVIVVDTGQGAHLLKSGAELHPFARWEVAFRIEPEQEIGPQLKALGVGRRDVRRVVLTHMHMDHDGGLAHFADTEVLVARGELEKARGLAGRARGYLPQRRPRGFDPTPLDLTPQSNGPFLFSKELTADGTVVAVATPGHTADHISVLVQSDQSVIMLAGDTSYSEELMLGGVVDGVSADEKVSAATLTAIQRLARERPTVYLPTHDPDSARRLAAMTIAAHV
jgi:glyoxylase-like metal-dependent hydrolase (beta-lactamase superfamily II)